jgi:hypothetical protein
MELVNRQEKTLDGLRSRLYDTLDEVIKGTVKGPQVECICAVSEQIIKSAKLEVDTLLRLDENKRAEQRETRESANKLKGVIDAIEVSTLSQ